MRKRMTARRDRRVFARTAAKTKSINVASSFMRGGVRL